MSEESILTGKVPSELLDERSVFTVSLVSGETSEENIYEVETSLSSPWGIDTDRFLPNTTPMSLDRFFNVASRVIADAQNREGREIETKVLLSEEYPPEELASFGDEVICYRLISRVPGNMNATGTGRPQRKSMYSYDLQDPNFPNKMITIESRPVDHVIEFTCWAKSNKVANRRAVWLEKLFITHAWAFEVNGVERFYWKGRGTDSYTTHNGQRLFSRPINFFVRFREFEIKSSPLISTIEFDIGVK